MRKKIRKYIYVGIALIIGVLFVARFGGPAILRAYIEAGVGNCRAIPLLCTSAEKELINPKIDEEYINGLLPYTFPGVNISIPRGFTVIKGKVTKVYYKKKKYTVKTPVIYLLYQKPGFFIGLFPQLRQRGITTNYEFVNRTITAQFTNIDNITDAFFVIMKSVFTPNVGDQKNLKIIRFTIPDKRGFITYNTDSTGNYFDCDIIGSQDEFFKVYIKDKGMKLDLDKVLSVISTMVTSDLAKLDSFR